MREASPGLLARLAKVQASAIFALSGAAFGIGTLLLARVMPVPEFGRFAWAIALFNIFAVIAPLGLDQVMLRHSIRVGGRLLKVLVLAGMGMGAGVAFGVTSLAGFPWTEAALLALAISSGGVIFAVAAGLRAAFRELAALLVLTTANWLLLGIGLLALVVPMQDSLVPLALYAAGEAMAACIAWAMLLRGRGSAPAPATPIPWPEAVSFLGIAAIGTIMLQLERLLVPAALGFEPLALFSVLASVAIFPFRLITASAGFGLVPRLRATSDTALRRRLVRSELLSIAVLLTGASICVILAAPVVTTLVTEGRYEIGGSLVLAACANGSSKVLQAVPRAILTGCGKARDIAALNRLGWLGLAMSTLCALVLGGWGLEGIIWGVALGSLAGSLPAAALARRRLGGTG
ncbi:lipopolysaccharide biosynthesis protein [Falsiroseomonas sp. HC035]|uniref:lipopolysaccharide biosynthesis protein n=1 Tax=Falsiroseomonas sp. HC035 TaxID=3390999 RepID=UPI003D318632